ncbi:MAG: nickel pincer cofactor biosynthesis protein LarC [Microcystis sp. M113S1]|uniref:nickel pincer cofactor biosynthesis protein LarC n=1 Tax=Microcystis sp. M113S1 TaxID=2771104 RepID=UPI00258F3936|nr:nickel pincer cofactor biosynthesis protein LarC [Microcystis sp. M113S1]MCA2939082.1 nickel pincer cofactor biosynthesis protein LarC [Microcystis sp. M113S1]
MERVNSSHDSKIVAYWDCPTGIAGDMCLGALVDLGVPLEYLIAQLKTLGIEDEYQLRAEKVHRRGQIATKVHVDVTAEKSDHHHHHHHHTPARHLPEIENLIKQANLPQKVQEWSLAVFQQLAIAEGAVHGIAPEKVHFHEVGATDAIIDIVGTCLGLDWLSVSELYCSSLPTGGGTVQAAHGRLPVPVPAVVQLLSNRQVPIYSNGIAAELVTPTGAAIVTTLAKSFGKPPKMQLEKVGLGAGTKDLPIPNLVRLWLGKKAPEKLDEIETVAVLETQIDDLNPQAIAYLSEALLQAGALDVFSQAITMKKSRFGILLTVICGLDKIAICENMIFQETTTLGIRRTIQERSILKREIQSIDTVYGQIRLKVAYKESINQPITVQPEYEDCAAIARQHHLPWRFVHQMALAIWQEKNQS